jgi:hypothetical protein
MRRVFVMQLLKRPVSELTKRTRDVESSFERLPKWPEMRALLQHGLTPQEGVEIIVSDEEAVKYNLTHRRTGGRFLKNFVKDLGTH